MISIQINTQDIDTIQSDLQNWLSLYSAPYSQLPVEDALSQVLALEALAAKIRQTIATQVSAFDS